MNARNFASVATLLSLAACSSDSEPKRLPPAAPAPVSAPSPAATARPAPDAPTPSARGTLAFAPQPGWVEEKPSSTARKAQYLLPRAEPDTEDASLVVTYFSGQGGTQEGNLKRWADQFEQPDGRPSAEVIRSASRSVNGMNVFEVDISGTYVAETFPNSGIRYNKPGWRMLASIVYSDPGPHFVKLVGPEATVAKWEASYRGFISSLKPGS